MSFAVGATIDFIAGVQKRVPKWMRDIGMEWFYRLKSDPRRLFKRYVISDSKYLYYISEVLAEIKE